MVALKKIGLLSLAKFYAIYMAILGVIVSVLLAAVPTQYSTPTLIIFAPGIFALVGFITGFLNAVVYNGLSMSIGGVKLDYRNGTIASIDPLSFAKIYCVISGIYGLAYANIVGFITYLIIGFAAAIIIAYLYNFFSKEVGGIKVRINNDVLTKVEWLPASKMAALLLAVLVLAMELLVAVAGALLPGYLPSTGTFSIGAVLAVALGTGILTLILAMFIGFVAMAFDASFYNFLAKNIKGIELYLG